MAKNDAYRDTQRLRTNAEYERLRLERDDLAQRLEVAEIERNAFRGVLVDQGRVEQPKRRLLRSA